MTRAFLATIICALLVTQACALTLTPREVADCYPDARRFCGVTEADRHAGFLRKVEIGICMRFHRSKVSPRCLAVFKEHGY